MGGAGCVEVVVWICSAVGFGRGGKAEREGLRLQFITGCGVAVGVRGWEGAGGAVPGRLYPGAVQEYCERKEGGGGGRLKVVLPWFGLTVTVYRRYSKSEFQRMLG